MAGWFGGPNLIRLQTCAAFRRGILTLAEGNFPEIINSEILF